MASEDKTVKGDRTEMDAGEFHNMLRESMDNANVDQEVNAKKLEPPKVETVEKEPEVKETRVEKREPKVEVEEDEVVKLRRENEDYKRRLEVTDTRRVDTTRREPEIEMVEVVPGTGIKLPKDRRQWAIQLNEGMVEAVGLDKSATKGLEILGNIFYNFIAETIPGAAFKMYQEHDRVKSSQSAREREFFTLFPDLQDHKDLSEFVESKEREALLSSGYRGEAYFKEVGRRTRQRIAVMRGVSLEDYERSLTKTDSQQRRTTGGRAVTTSAGSRVRPTPNDENKELNDMMG